MSSDIFYDRLIGPSIVSGSNQTTTTLTVSSETAPTSPPARNYGNLIVQVSSPGTGWTAVSTCTDTQDEAYTLVKEVLFAGYALDIFARINTAPNVASTITTTHQPSNHRIILSDEWYNLNSLQKIVSAYAVTAVSQVEVGDFHVGQKHSLVYAVLAIGGSPHSDSVSIPNDWILLHDVGTNYGDSNDVRLVITGKIVNNHAKVNFQPIISNARVWGSCMFSFKAKL